MVVLYLYLKHNNNIAACVPFRYNIDDDKVTESREMIVDVDPEETFDSIRQRVVQILDKEKMDYGKESNDFTSGMSNVVTVQ